MWIANGLSTFYSKLRIPHSKSVSATVLLSLSLFSIGQRMLTTHHEGGYWLGNILCTFMTAAGESAVYYPHDGGG
jgi:hypothetical protein